MLSAVWNVGKWLIPFYWPIGIGKAVVEMPLWLGRKLWSMTKKGWEKLPKPKSTLGKCIVYPIYGWITIPGTVPMSIAWAASAIGYEKEVMAVYDAAISAGGWLATAGIEVLGKVMAAGLAMVLTALL